MVELPRSSRSLKRVARRLELAAFGRCAYRIFLACCGLYATALLACRLTGMYTEWLSLASFACVPAAAALAAFAWHHRPTLTEAAREVDRHHGTKDLFLTA